MFFFYSLLQSTDYFRIPLPVLDARTKKKLTTEIKKKNTALAKSSFYCCDLFFGCFFFVLLMFKRTVSVPRYTNRKNKRAMLSVCGCVRLKNSLHSYNGNQHTCERAEALDLARTLRCVALKNLVYRVFAARAPNKKKTCQI